MNKTLIFLIIRTKHSRQNLSRTRQTVIQYLRPLQPSTFQTKVSSLPILISFLTFHVPDNHRFQYSICIDTTSVSCIREPNSAGGWDQHLQFLYPDDLSGIFVVLFHIFFLVEISPYQYKIRDRSSRQNCNIANSIFGILAIPFIWPKEAATS